MGLSTVQVKDNVVISGNYKSEIFKERMGSFESTWI